MRNDGAQSTGSYSGAGTPVQYNTTPTSNGSATQSVARPTEGVSTFDSDKVSSLGTLTHTEAPTVTKFWSNDTIKTEDSVTMGESLVGNSAVKAYKGQILHDQGNKNIGNAQESSELLAAKTELEKQGWKFVKKPDGDCLYVGNNFLTGQFGFGLDIHGQLVNFEQNESFALVGR